MSEESDFRQALVARPDPAASRRHLPSLPSDGPGWFCMHSASADASVAPHALRAVGVWWPEGSDPVLYAVSRNRRLLESRVAKPQLAAIAEYQRRRLSEEFDLAGGLWVEEWLAQLCWLGSAPGMRFSAPPAALRIEFAWHPWSFLGRHHAGAASEAALQMLWHHLVAELDPEVLRALAASGLPATVGHYNLRCAARAGVASREAVE